MSERVLLRNLKRGGAWLHIPGEGPETVDTEAAEAGACSYWRGEGRRVCVERSVPAPPLCGRSYTCGWRIPDMAAVLGCGIGCVWLLLLVLLALALLAPAKSATSYLWNGAAALVRAAACCWCWCCWLWNRLSSSCCIRCTLCCCAEETEEEVVACMPRCTMVVGV